MNPLLETAGQIAAIIICLFALVFIILAVAFNLAMAFGMSWLGEKMQAIKMLRPTVESVNKATESALQGISPDQSENSFIRTVASIPLTIHNLENKVDQSTNKVAGAVIEFRARTVQAKTILKALFLPGLMGRKQAAVGDEASIEWNSQDYERAVKQRPEAIPVESPPPDTSTREHIEPVEQIQHAPLY